MPSLSVRLALPLIAVLLAGSVGAGHAQTDACKEFCSTRKLFGFWTACISLSGYLKGAGCMDSPKGDQEPCVTLQKQFQFACELTPDPKIKPIVGAPCSWKWNNLCQAGGIVPGAREVAPPSYSIPKNEPGTAKLDMCTALCTSPSMSMTEVCGSLALYVGFAPPEGAGCPDPASKQEPCPTVYKQFNFICNEKNFYAKPNGFCSKPWTQACHAGGWPPAKVSIPGGSGVPVTPPQSSQACPPNMTRNASGRGCVPKLDTLGGDGTPGSTPGAARTAPGSPSVPSAVSAPAPMTAPASPPPPPAGRR